MTSHVMVTCITGRHSACMKNAASLLLVLAVFVPFTAFSLYVVGSQGLVGLLALGREPWGLQVIVDLFVSLGIFSVWMLRDAKERGITGWPYVIAIAALGSIGALGYLLHRSVKELSASGSSAARSSVAG